jgi:UPF0755 protein
MAVKSGKKTSKFKKFAISLLLILAIGTGIAFWAGYTFVFKSNVSIGDKKSEFIYIKTGWNFQDVMQMLEENDLIKNTASFEWLAEKKGYKNAIKPGKYRIRKGMNNNELINLLKAGLAETVAFTLNEVRTKEQLASRVGGKLEVDSATILDALNDEEFLNQYGLNRETALTLFIPDKYQFNWNTSVDQFFQRMARSYKAFWNDERKSRAKKLGLSQSEVMILASIVQQESYIESERPLIAGVYMNRLKVGMPLQADPTLIWAVGDFSIRRVLDVHKEIDSPYNTYRYKGLPPGPICLALPSTIDAVLYHPKHDYLYFCAKPDLSGYSLFARDYKQHQVNARKYQEAMDKRKILK